MRFLLIFITIISATVLEWSAAGKVDFFGVPIPLAVSVVIFWFWRVPFVSRIWLAVWAGIFFDTLSLYPRGLFILSFGVAALAAEFLKRIFTPTFGYGSGFVSPALARIGFTPLFGDILRFWRRVISSVVSSRGSHIHGQRAGFTSIDSIFSQIVGMGAGIFIVLFSVFFGGLGVEYGASGFEQIPVALLGNAALGFIFWAILIPVCVFAGLALGKKLRHSHD